MKKGIFIYFLLINFYIYAQTKTAISLSEVMFYPLETNGEFIELYNSSHNLSFNLSKYKIIYSTSSADTIVEFNNGIILKPKNYAVILENDYNFSEGIYSSLITDSTLVLQIDNGKYGSSGMANTSDRAIYLINEIGDTIDTYTYTANNSAGYSDEKILVEEDNNFENWSNSSLLNGTPGFNNSVSPKNNDLAISHLTFSPETISEESETEFSLGIKNLGLKDAANFGIKLFVDLNHDSTAQSDEIILESIEPLLLSGDSLILNSQISFTTSGLFNLFAEVDFEVDDYIQNNYYSKQIDIQPKPNEYNDIVINEIMYNPKGDQPEWIELYNRTSDVINLKDWKIADRTSKALIDDSTYFIAGNDYLILTDDNNLLNFFDISSDVKVINLPSLNNTDDDIKLLNPQMKIIDSVAYKSSWGGKDGYSLERVSSELSSSNINNWKSSISKYFATPGGVNSVTPRNIDLAISEIIIHPKYAIVGESIELTIKVKNIGLSAIENFLIEIYNDVNIDSVAQSEELTRSISGAFIEAGDSLIYIELINDFSEGNNNLIINLILDDDDNLENNISIVSFIGIVINEVRNDIVINEIMHSPKSPEPEWIEIYNRSTKSINLKNYQVADLIDTIQAFPNEIILHPNEYYIIADDSSFISIYPKVKNYVIAEIPNLNNSGDRIIILDSLNRIIDSLFYIDSWGGNSGKSLERIDCESSSIDSANWNSSNFTIGGTPGKINSISIKDFDIAITEIIFNPDKPAFGTDVAISAKVKNAGKQSLDFFIDLYEDINSDSTNIQLIETSNFISLNSNDSINYQFSSQIINIKQRHNYIIKAIVGNDQDTTNNLLKDSINPGFNKSSIIVNEIMYSPINGEPEWIELFNTTNNIINVQGFSISDIRTTPKLTTITNDSFIEPNGFLVIAKDSTIFDYHSSILSPVNILSFANLNNDIDGIVLKDSFGELIDSVEYKSNWGGTNGFSLERINSNISLSDSSNWKSSIDVELSTPGRQNSITPFSSDIQIVELKTIPKNPTLNDIVFIQATIRNIGLNNIDNYSVKFEYLIGNQLSFLGEIDLSNLSIGDSTKVISNESFQMADSVVILAEANYLMDENILNNKLAKTFYSGAQWNSILINEFMANPNSEISEWIEIFNNSENDIDISNWFISDLYTTPKISKIANAPLILEKNDFLIITNDTSKLDLPNINVIEAKFGTLGNIEDGIIIYDFNQKVVDSLKYDKDWKIKKGRSFERFSINEQSTDISNWLPSLAITGSSPGLSNSILNTSPANGQSIIINELMFDPEIGNSEFVELYNSTEEDIDIGGWELIINETDFFEISSSFFLLKSGGYFVIASDSSILTNYIGLNDSNYTILTSGPLSLSNSGESIVVIDHWGNLIDSLFYNPKWHNKNIATTKNKSLERISHSISANEPTNWSTSVFKNGASPTKANSIFAKNENIKSGISFNPNPFSPDNDGFEDFSIINYSLPFNTAQLRVKIFDDNGRLVRTLSNNEAVAKTGSIIFDGLNNNGNPLRIGMYIVFLEAIDNSSGKSTSFKDVIVVARKL
ncbi:MAG: lamin tail domain-containing protein [Bacteroidetes bacterium]|nr:lamin tail domain-containing protein [Bacteroidota bacterium]MBU1797493.1 lamin tail domain-containing protein [Bacteroidota bacterium]